MLLATRPFSLSVTPEKEGEGERRKRERETKGDKRETKGDKRQSKRNPGPEVEKSWGEMPALRKQ